MSIEIQFNSITLQPEDLQEQLPALLEMVNSYLPKKKTPKRRKPRKKRETVGPLIQEIIDSIDK